jgi:chromosome segregation ATPase
MMVTLEHIQLLENRVKQAVELISALRDENSTLQKTLSSYETRMEELEVLMETFKRDQGKIEEGILSALKQLDTLEAAAPSAAATPAEASGDAELQEEENDEDNVEADEADDADSSGETGELDIF